MTAPLPFVVSADALTGAQRAAVLVIALGVETAGKMLPSLTDDEAERVSIEVARMHSIPGPLVEDVLHAFLSAREVRSTAPVVGGLDTARTLLRTGFDETRQAALIPRLEAATEGTGFDLVQGVDADRLAAFLSAEHPQTAAVVLAHLSARKAADTLAQLPADVRADVVRRLSTLGPTPEHVLRDLDAVLRREFGPTRGPAALGGVKRAADILTQSGKETGRAVLDGLQALDESLATQIEDLLFIFDDLIHMPDRSLSRVLNGIDQSVLALALRGCDEALEARIFASVSERVANGIREEIELSGAARVSDVEDAQRSVVEATLALAEAGEIELRAENEASLA
jgi:flagellar motor switch protein FliG